MVEICVHADTFYLELRGHKEGNASVVERMGFPCADRKCNLSCIDGRSRDVWILRGGFNHAEQVRHLCRLWGVDMQIWHQVGDGPIYTGRRISPQ